MKRTFLQRALWLLLALLIPLAAQAGPETTILFSGNSLGEFNPCPS